MNLISRVRKDFVIEGYYKIVIDKHGNPRFKRIEVN